MKCKHYTQFNHSSLSHPINMCACNGELPNEWSREEIREIWGLPIDGTCDICNKKTESFAGDPDKWPIELPYKDGNGKKKIYHRECVVECIEKIKVINEINEEYEGEM